MKFADMMRTRRNSNIHARIYSCQAWSSARALNFSCWMCVCVCVWKCEVLHTKCRYSHHVCVEKTQIHAWRGGGFSLFRHLMPSIYHCHSISQFFYKISPLHKYVDDARMHHTSPDLIKTNFAAGNPHNTRICRDLDKCYKSHEFKVK